MRWLGIPILIGALVGPPGLARAQTEVDYGVDATLTAAAFAGGFLFYLVPMDTEARWEGELFSFDEPVRGMFSNRAAAVSDAAIISTFVLPVAAQLGFGIDEAFGQNALVYGETLGVSFLLNSAVKHLVQRPRPFNYHPDARVQALAAGSGSSSHVSFYSGHAALSFSAAVAGSYLFALRSEDATARAVLWGVELALATATANLRVRAGAHFYSDVIVGAVVGSALGFLIPFLHQPGLETYEPEAGEWLAMAGGILVGLAASQLLPLPSDVPVLIDDGKTPDATAIRWRLAPYASDAGAGLLLGARF